MKNIIGFALITLLAILGCRPKPLIIKIDQPEPEVVVFSQLIPDRIMTVVLTKTISALEFSEENGEQADSSMVSKMLEQNASVKISYKGNSHDLIEVAPGIYSSIEILQYPNEEYRLDVKTKSGKEVSAVTRMLPKIQFDTVTPVIQRNADDTLVTVKYKFKDLAEKNWYMINFYKQTSFTSSGLSFGNFFNTGSSSLSHTFLIDDAVLGATNIIEGTIELPEVSPTDSLVVSLANISEKYYKYLEGRQKAGTLFTQITKEPIHAPTNIVGGRGFFNTHFPSLKFYDLNDY